MNLTQQIQVLISAANVRRDQWKALVDNKHSAQPTDYLLGGWSPDDSIKELWEVWAAMREDPDDNEAEIMSNIITKAIEEVQAVIDIGGFGEEIDIGNK